MKYIFVISGNHERAQSQEYLQQHMPYIESQLKSRGDIMDVYVATGEGDATRYVRIYCDLHAQEQVRFVACGGDIAIHEVASGMVGFESKSMAVLQVPSCGCDFVKYYADRDFTDVHNLFQGTTHDIDILKVNDSYAVNVCNFGFTSEVPYRATMLLEQGKSIEQAYNYGVLHALVSARYNKIRIEADGKKVGGRYMLCCDLANGSHVGGSYVCAPDAVNDDGWIDMSLIKPMTLIRTAMATKLYAIGQHYKNPKYSKYCIYKRVKHVKVSSKDLIRLCLDGAMLAGTQFEIDILPKAVTLWLPPQKENNTK